MLNPSQPLQFPRLDQNHGAVCMDFMSPHRVYYRKMDGKKDELLIINVKDLLPEEKQQIFYLEVPPFLLYILFLPSPHSSL